MKKYKKDANRKKENKKKEESDEGHFQLEHKTRHGILAVISFIVGLFFILSSLGIAGTAGRITYQYLSELFGLGFFIFPLLSFLLVFSFAKESRPNFAGTTALGGVFFFLASLGLISVLAGTTQGGFIGSLVTKPLLYVFDIYFTIPLLLGVFGISLLLIFSAGLPKISTLWRKKELAQETPVPLSTLSPTLEAKIEKEIYEQKPDDSRVKKESAAPEKDISYSFHLLRKGVYAPPPLNLLEHQSGKPAYGDIKANSNLIKRTLQNFGIEVEVDDVSIGPSVTRYALKPAEGVRLAKIVALQDNLALALAAHPLRIEAPIPGKSLVGIEIPNQRKAMVHLGALLSASEFKERPTPLLVAMGQSVTGTPAFVNLAKAPHMLVAGATGSGKSVAIHSLILSLLYRNSPDMLQFILVDPKRVELTMYKNIPHLLTPVITEPKGAIKALRWAISEMNRRYSMLEEHGARDIESYHQNVLGPALEKGVAEDDAPMGMPYIVVVIDELASIMQTYPRELESAIVSLAQMSRAVGIHLILSTQRPSVNVITGLIKANIPTRVALQVTSQIDSRTILDTSGAEKLLGQGDMLYQGSEMAKPVRLQSAFVTETEVKKVVKYLADSYESLPKETLMLETESEGLSISLNNDGDGDDDEMYPQAKALVLESGRASTSFLQRRLGLGYSRAAKLLDILEERGVVGPANGSKAREVFGKKEDTVSTLSEEV